MAKGKNSAPPRTIKLQVTRKRDDGSIEICAEWQLNSDATIWPLPLEFARALNAVAAGDRKSNLRPAPPEPDLLGRARLGEFEPLISHFENGGELTDSERRALAMIARGAFPRMGRPPETETEMRNRNIVRFVEVLKEYGGKRVIDIAAAKFGVDRSYIPKLLKKYRGESGPAELMGYLLDARGADSETIRKAVLAFADVNEDDLREATGRKKVRK
jgi:hypothetical protein